MTSSPKIGNFGAKWGKEWYDVYPQQTRFYFWVFFYICANFGENPSRNASVRVHADGHTDRGKLVL